MSIIGGKKILYLITQSKYGGAQKYLLDLAEYFGHDNEIVIAVGDKKAPDDYFFEQAKKLNVRVVVLNHLVRGISLVQAYEALWEIRKLLRNEQPDIMHINSSMAGVVGSLAAWLYHFDPLNKIVRVVYTAHGFVFNEPLTFWRKQMYIFLEKFSASFKAAIITVSEYDKIAGLKHKIAPAGRFVVIPNGLDYSSMVFLPRAQARQELGLPSGDGHFVFGVLASLYPTKGLPYLLRAFHEVQQLRPQIALVIMGQGPESESLKNLISQLQLEKKVTITYRPLAWPYLKAFDSYVLSSVKEGFPFSLLEAAAAGLPVIATKVGGLPEIIDSEATGIIVPAADVSALAKAMEQLMTDKIKRAALGSALQKKVTTEFTLAKMLTATEAVYLKLSPPKKSPEI